MPPGRLTDVAGRPRWSATRSTPRTSGPASSRNASSGTASGNSRAEPGDRWRSARDRSRGPPAPPMIRGPRGDAKALGEPAEALSIPAAQGVDEVGDFRQGHKVL